MSDDRDALAHYSAMLDEARRPHLHHYVDGICADPRAPGGPCGESQVYRPPTGKPQPVARAEGLVAAAPPEYGEHSVLVLLNEPPTGRKFRAGETVEVVSSFA